MKQQAKLFCRTNQPLEDIQRGSLCYVYSELLRVFNPMNPQLVALGPLECLNAMVLLSQVIPSELLKRVFDHLFAVQSEERVKAAPNSKKKIFSIDDLMVTRESIRVFSLINDWVWQHLPSKEMMLASSSSSSSKSQLSMFPIHEYVNRLKKHRAEIVLLMKALERNQCQNDAVDTFQKMVLFVQTQNENINTQLHTQSSRVKMTENLIKISKMNVNLAASSTSSSSSIQQQQQQQQQQHAINLKRRFTAPIVIKQQQEADSFKISANMPYIMHQKI